MKLKLKVLENKYSIYKFDSNNPLPSWIFSSEFYAITKTEDELSVIAHQKNFEKEECGINKDWRIIKVLGPLDFSLIGIIADISKILKEEQISIFVISTYDTDYILVKEKDLDNAISALQKEGYNFEDC